MHQGTPAGCGRPAATLLVTLPPVLRVRRGPTGPGRPPPAPIARRASDPQGGRAGATRGARPPRPGHHGRPGQDDAVRLRRPLARPRRHDPRRGHRGRVRPLPAQPRPPGPGRPPAARAAAAAPERPVRAAAPGWPPGGLSARTVRNVHKTLHRMLHQAVRWRLLAVNPAADLELPPVVEPQMVTLDHGQARQLLEVAAGPGRAGWWPPLLLLAVATGARRGELLALRWSDLDLDAGTVRIGRSLRRGQAGLRYKPPKTA